MATFTPALVERLARVPEGFGTAVPNSTPAQPGWAPPRPRGVYAYRVVLAIQPSGRETMIALQSGACTLTELLNDALLILALTAPEDATVATYVRHESLGYYNLNADAARAWDKEYADAYDAKDGHPLQGHHG